MRSYALFFLLFFSFFEKTHFHYSFGIKPFSFLFFSERNLLIKQLKGCKSVKKQLKLQNNTHKEKSKN
ncbi:hypothetical protein PRUPE_4G141900 [Prunus persica]|uniref:Secreted protein n=1 Tax=Prunus persica TaxID=3760 RepID=A0A251PKH3_PRUPE|nr:hypothetical protein PRUPE_4G141900 [Prunus persica]